MAEDKTYIYCNVLLANNQSPYLYICDFQVHPGDIVVVPVHPENIEKVGLVLDVNGYTDANAPRPAERTKHILRLFGDDESATLMSEKSKVEAERAVRFIPPDRLEKLSIKASLLKYGVGRKKINAGKEKFRAILKGLPEKTKIVSELYGGIRLSYDGKTVTRFEGPKKKGKITVCIPSGVETIEDNAFLRVKINTLFISKTVKYLGKYTLNGPHGEPKPIESIEVEDGSESFFSDESGFYSIADGKKILIRMLNHSLTSYTAASDITDFEDNAFAGCHMLQKIILPEGVTSFNENALGDDTQVQEVFLPKTVKHLCLKNRFGVHGNRCDTISYHIDEESEYLFTDEDSIYEVLEDGTYKLISCLYTGKGKVLMLEGTGIIGAGAFERHKNVTKVTFPKSLCIIEPKAFSRTGLKTLFVPDGIQRIESGAFSWCQELKSVTLPSSLEYIAPDAFENCQNLRRIKSDGGTPVFSYQNGVVKQLFSTAAPKDLTPAGDADYSWMAGKIFVHTGLSAADERKFEQIVTANGGVVKSSTVSATDYLVYNAAYDHETVKLKKAKQLMEQGKPITVLSLEEWSEKLGITSKNQSGDAISATMSVSQRDYFDEFANTIVKTITEESVALKSHVSDRAKYDMQRRVVSVILTFSQQSDSADVVKERVSCAETLRENDPVKVIPKSEAWEITAANGQSLGKLGELMARQAAPYISFITISGGTVERITPKSKRSSKYAIGSVKFDITERSMPSNMSEEDLVTAAQFSYLIDDSEAHLIRWIGDASVKSVRIPAMIEGKPLLTVDSGLFESEMLTEIENHIEEIIISEGVKRLDAKVLFHIPYLKKVVFPAAIEYISPYVFSDKNGGYRDFYLNQRTICVAPADSYADKFLKAYKPSCYGLESLTVANDDSEAEMLAAFRIESDGNGFTARFKDINMLDGFKKKTVAVLAKVNGQDITGFDLSEIPGFVEKLIIPASVTHFVNIDHYLFPCDIGHSLRTIEISADNPNYWSDGYAIFSKDRKVLLRFLSYTTKEYSVPAGTEVIAAYAFEPSRNLEKLTLPESINRIESHAFYKCGKLAEINGLEYVSEVGEKIFSGDDTWSGDPVPFEQKTPFLIIGSSLLRYNEQSQRIVKVPEGITKICASAFGRLNENDQVEEIVLPSSVKIIEKNAFRGRKQLKKINIPDGVKEIPGGTFAECEKLESIYIPASVETIDATAFRTFHECALKAIEVDKDNKNYCSVNGMLLSKDKTELLLIPGGTRNSGFEIPEGVSKINSRAAYSNMALTELVFPSSLKTIGKSAFHGCENLERVEFPEGLEIIGKYAFSECKKLGTIVWPKKLRKIGDWAFKKTGLGAAALPDTLEYVGFEAFANTAMEIVTVPKSVKTLGCGAFSCIPVIEVYDSVDPDAQDADKAIDTVNGRPNSMVGYIGIGPAWAQWDCAANHRWADYTVVVRSSETDEIKYKVWMGATSQREYYCFLSSAWGRNATFAFRQLDDFFPKILGEEHKLKVAEYRLEYPIELTDKTKAKYEAYIERYSKKKEN